MRADVDMDVAAFADEAHRAPHLGRADRVQPGLRIAGGVKRQIGVTSVGEILDRGDRGFLDDDGWLFLMDRKADMIISGGANIYPAEIESVLITHPKIAMVSLPDRFMRRSAL